MIASPALTANPPFPLSCVGYGESAYSLSKVAPARAEVTVIQTNEAFQSDLRWPGKSKRAGKTTGEKAAPSCSHGESQSAGWRKIPLRQVCVRGFLGRQRFCSWAGLCAQNLTGAYADDQLGKIHIYIHTQLANATGFVMRVMGPWL